MPPFSPTDYSGLDSLSTGTMILDAGRRILYVNPAAETLLGVSGVLLLGDDAMSVFERSPELLAAVQTASTQQETVIEYELDVVVAVDPHLRIARLEQARLQQEANRELLRNLAHEIKNPLGGIRGAAQLLEHELPRESLREYTQVIIKESDRLQSLMERLLTPHRMPRFGAVNIHEVLERVRSLILAETPSMSLRRDYDISLPEIRADAEQLIQATLNIARNAVQAMHGQGEIIFKTRVARQITLESRRYQLGMRVEIIDNGPGIPEEIREQIFFPLVSGREGGSGLGLAVAQTLVAQNHGTIDCESRPGHTAFSIFLPLPG